MRRTIWLLALALPLGGCARSDVPKEKYFSGQPVEHWLQAITGPDAKARKKAADVLGNVGPVAPEAVPALVRAVKDRDASVRDAAVLALSKIGRAAVEALPALEAAKADPSPTVRTHAALAVGRVSGTR